MEAVGPKPPIHGLGLQNDERVFLRDREFIGDFAREYGHCSHDSFEPLFLQKCFFIRVRSPRAVDGSCWETDGFWTQINTPYFFRGSLPKLPQGIMPPATQLTRDIHNPWKTYVKLCVVLMRSQGLTKGSLMFLNYPAQIMFKSTKMEMLFYSIAMGIPFLIPPMILTRELFKAWEARLQQQPPS